MSQGLFRLWQRRRRCALQPKELFGGGTGGGVTITPLAFLIVKNGDVEAAAGCRATTIPPNRVVGMVPDVVDKVSGLISGSKRKKPAEEE